MRKQKSTREKGRNREYMTKEQIDIKQRKNIKITKKDIEQRSTNVDGLKRERI